MRIAMFTNTYLPHMGGVARSVDTFASLFRQLGHRVRIVAPEFDGQDEQEQDVVRVPAIANFNNSSFSVQIPMPGLIADAMDAFMPDIIHSHHPFLLGSAGLRMAASVGCPLVFTHHTLYEQYTHYLAEDSEILERLAIEMATEYANLCDTVLVPSESVGRLISERGVTAPIEVLPTGVDRKRFASGDGQRLRQQEQIKDEEFVFGHVGRLAREKNLPFLAEAVVTAIEKRGQGVFVVVGSGPAEDEIKTMFEQRGLSQSLHLTGPKKGQDLIDAYAAIDLFVFASQSETQGMVLTEALAADCPVVALDGSGVREVVRDGENGFLLPATADCKQFADKLLLASAAETFRKLQASAAASIEGFDHELLAGKALRIYRALQQQAKRAHAEDSFLEMDRIADRLEAEWKLLAGKTAAAYHALVGE